MSRRRAFNGAVRRYAPLLVLSCGAAFLLPLIARGQLKSASTPPAPTPDGTAKVPPPPTAFAQLSSEVAAIFAKSKDAVVRIKATDPFGTCVGTGFFIDPSGTIYTHYSVVGQSSNVLVEFAGKKYPATCLLADPRSGVTLLSIHAGSTPFLPLGHSAELKIASPIIAIGYPMDLPLTPTFGLVAGFDQKVPEGYLPTTHIRANVPHAARRTGRAAARREGRGRGHGSLRVRLRRGMPGTADPGSGESARGLPAFRSDAPRLGGSFCQAGRRRGRRRRRDGR